MAKYPFPKATATTEILVSGAKGGNQSQIIIGKWIDWRHLRFLHDQLSIMG